MFHFDYFKIIIQTSGWNFSLLEQVHVSATVFKGSALVENPSES